MADKWITIGGEKDGKTGERRGGQPVLIDGETGEIKGGSIPAEMQGTKIGEAGKNFDTIEAAKNRSGELKTADGRKMYKHGGLYFTRRSGGYDRHRRVIWADVAKLDEAWSKDDRLYIPKGGGGAEIGGRRQGFRDFLKGGGGKKNKPIEMPQVNVDADGVAYFSDGRHRFSTLRDAGFKVVPILVERVSAKQAKKFVGDKDSYAKGCDTRNAKARYKMPVKTSTYQALAEQKFKPDEYEHVPNVVIFAEHETVDSQGNPQKYGLGELKAIARRCNQRIKDTGDFAVITEGHTPEDDGGKMPEVIGFAGPFSVGEAGWTTDKKTGQRRKRYAIYADEWRIKEDAKKFRKLPRRSVELWMHDNVNERFIDPIAALGAETPRLDLGIKFAKLPTGVTVEKYTAVAPSGSNTFIPGSKNKNTEKPKQEAYAVANSELVREVVEALESLDWVQFIKNQMAESTDENSGEQADIDAVEGEEGGDRELYNEDDLDNDELDFAGEMDDEYMSEEEYVKKHAAKARANYRAMRKRHEAGDGMDLDDELKPAAYGKKRHSRTASQQIDGFREKYEKANAARRKEAAEKKVLQEKYSQLESRMNVVEREREDAKREREIARLQNEYAIDEEKVEELRERCLYSRNKHAMSPEQFVEHIETIEGFATPIPIGRSLPRGVLPMTESAHKQSQKINDETVRRAEQYRRQGKQMKYSDVRAEVERELAG